MTVIKELSEEFGHIVRLATHQEIAKLGIENFTEFNKPGTKVDIARYRELLQYEQTISREAQKQFLTNIESVSEVPDSKIVLSGDARVVAVTAEKAWNIPTSPPVGDVAVGGGWCIIHGIADTATMRIVHITGYDYRTVTPPLPVGYNYVPNSFQSVIYSSGATNVIVNAIGDLYLTTLTEPITLVYSGAQRTAVFP
jgi:hypothetical protein